MATENRILDVTYEANEDLSSDQYRFVVLDPTTKKVRRPDSANEISLGVLQNAPAQGEAAVVRVEGISKIRAAGALAVNAKVTPEYVNATDAGKGKATTTAGDYVRGIVVEPVDAEDELAAIRLTEFYIHA